MSLPTSDMATKFRPEKETTMHIASEKLVGKMALGEAGLWATRINDGRDLVLVAKAPTDTIKWIQRGVEIEFVIAHIKVGERTVRCVALQVSDSTEDPSLLSCPQNLSEDHAPFDDLLGEASFTVYFHNENPFVSILEGVVTWDQSAIRTYLSTRAGEPLYGDHTNFVVFRTAQEQFERYALNKSSLPDCPFQIHRIPLRIEHMSWNSVAIRDSGTFEPGNSNEGGSQEDLIVQLLKPHFQGIVAKSPQIQVGTKMRELCDVLAFSDSYLFAIESKVFSVFDKSVQQSPDRRAKTIFGHFEKATDQLVGAVKRMAREVTISDESSKVETIGLSKFKAVHAIVVATTSNWKLPWDMIGVKLRTLSTSSIHFHFMTVMELQRTVAYCLGDTETLHLMLARRSEVVCGSGNANVRIDLLPGPPHCLNMPEVPATNRAIAFAFDGDQISKERSAFVPMLNLLFDQLLPLRRFSGRIEVRLEVGIFSEKPALWLAVAAGGTNSQLFDGNKEWWFSLLGELRSQCERKSWPVPLPRSGRIRRTSVLREVFPDLLVTVEFDEGRVIGRVSGAPDRESIPSAIPFRRDES